MSARSSLGSWVHIWEPSTNEDVPYGKPTSIQFLLQGYACRGRDFLQWLPSWLSGGCRNQNGMPGGAPSWFCCWRMFRSSLANFGRGWVDLLEWFAQFHWLYFASWYSWVPLLTLELILHLTRGLEGCIHGWHLYWSASWVVLVEQMCLCGCQRWVHLWGLVAYFLHWFPPMAICFHFWGWIPLATKGGGDQRPFGILVASENWSVTKRCVLICYQSFPKVVAIFFQNFPVVQCCCLW